MTVRRLTGFHTLCMKASFAGAVGGLLKFCCWVLLLFIEVASFYGPVGDVVPPHSSGVDFSFLDGAGTLRMWPIGCYNTLYLCFSASPSQPSDGMPNILCECILPVLLRPKMFFIEIELLLFIGLFPESCCVLLGPVRRFALNPRKVDGIWELISDAPFRDTD